MEFELNRWQLGTCFYLEFRIANAAMVLMRRLTLMPNLNDGANWRGSPIADEEFYYYRHFLFINYAVVALLNTNGMKALHGQWH